MPEQNQNLRGGKNQRCVGTLKVFALVRFWTFLILILVISTMVGMGRQGMHEIRHEIRRRKSL